MAHALELLDPVSKSCLGLHQQGGYNRSPCPSSTPQPLAEKPWDNTCEVLCYVFVEGAAVQILLQSNLEKIAKITHII